MPVSFRGFAPLSWLQVCLSPVSICFPWRMTWPVMCGVTCTVISVATMHNASFGPCITRQSCDTHKLLTYTLYLCCAPCSPFLSHSLARTYPIYMSTSLSLSGRHRLFLPCIISTHKTPLSSGEFSYIHVFKNVGTRRRRGAAYRSCHAPSG